MPVLFDAQERFPGGDLSSVPRIRFLMSVDFPPFNFTDQEGRLAGFHVDLVREICAQLKVESKCQVQALPFDELEAALEMGRAKRSFPASPPLPICARVSLSRGPIC